MVADNITLPREDVFEAAAWLFAFNELLEICEGITPSVLGGKWGEAAFGLVPALAGGDLPEDDEGFESHPVLVELFARARELAAGMARQAAEAATGEIEGHSYPFTVYGDPWTQKGLRHLSEKLDAAAKETRIQGVIEPRTAEHAS